MFDFVNVFTEYEKQRPPREKVLTSMITLWTTFLAGTGRKNSNQSE